MLRTQFKSWGRGCQSPCLGNANSSEGGLIAARDARNHFAQRCKLPGPLTPKGLSDPTRRKQCKASVDGGNTSSALYNEDVRLYDLSVSFRDFEEEVDFLQEVVEKHVGQPLKSALELASGPGCHAVALARRGVEVVALDNEEAMVAYGLAKANAEGVKMDYICGDMASFDSIPTKDGKVQLVYLLFGSVAHLLTNDDFIACLNSCRSVLAPNGIIVLELQHPNDVFKATELTGDAWEVNDTERESMLLVEWGRDTDEFDAISQVLQRHISFNVISKKGEIVSSKEVVLPQRLYTANEIDALARVCGFDIVQHCGALDLAVPLDDEQQACRMVVILKPQA